MEATIDDMQRAILAKESPTADQLVRTYLTRITAYNGTCVKEPDGMLGRIKTIPNAGQINALQTLNLRPAARSEVGLRRPQGAQHDGRGRRRSRDARRARGRGRARPQVCGHGQARRAAARRRDRDQGSVRHLRHAHHLGCRRVSTRTTGRPTTRRSSRGSREAGAIILAKANMGEYAGGASRSSFGGTFCNPYDTERSPGRLERAARAHPWPRIS